MDDVRDAAREALRGILKDMGPGYLGFIINQIKTFLKNGFELHVQSYTIHHLIKHLLKVRPPICAPKKQRNILYILTYINRAAL